MDENKTMKKKLIIQSFAPLFLILAIKNLTWEMIPPLVKLAECLRKREWNVLLRIPFHAMFLTYVLEMICVVWVVYALISIRSFMNLQTANFRSQGEKLAGVYKISDSGVTFFMTYVLPMVLDDVGTLRGFTVFVLLMVMLCALMWRTNLYYQNPVLTILGYDVVSFKFRDTQLSSFVQKECIGITRGKLGDESVIKRQYIADNVFLIYEDNVENADR